MRLSGIPGVYGYRRQWTRTAPDRRPGRRRATAEDCPDPHDRVLPGALPLARAGCAAAAQAEALHRRRAAPAGRRAACAKYGVAEGRFSRRHESRGQLRVVQVLAGGVFRAKLAELCQQSFRGQGDPLLRSRRRRHRPGHPGPDQGEDHRHAAGSGSIWSCSSRSCSGAICSSRTTRGRATTRSLSMSLRSSRWVRRTRVHECCAWSGRSWCERSLTARPVIRKYVPGSTSV